MMLELIKGFLYLVPASERYSLLDPTVGPHPAPSTLAVPKVDEFTTLQGRHCIWMLLSLRRSWGGGLIESCRKKRTEDRANVLLELQWTVDEAVRLAKENATLMLELNRAWQSTTSGTASKVPSTLATSVGRPQVPNLGQLEFVVSTLTGQEVACAHPAATFGSIPLCSCSA